MFALTGFEYLRARNISVTRPAHKYNVARMSDHSFVSELVESSYVLYSANNSYLTSFDRAHQHMIPSLRARAYEYAVYNSKTRATISSIVSSCVFFCVLYVRPKFVLKATESTATRMVLGANTQTKI